MITNVLPPFFMVHSLDQWLVHYLSKTLCKFNILCAQANSVILVITLCTIYIAREKEQASFTLSPVTTADTAAVKFVKDTNCYHN